MDNRVYEEMKEVWANGYQDDGNKNHVFDDMLDDILDYQQYKGIKYKLKSRNQEGKLKPQRKVSETL